MLENIQDIVKACCADAFGKTPEAVAIEFPADRAFGDLTVNAFLLARDLRMAAPLIAQELATRLAGRSPIQTAQAVKGYVNLRLGDADLFTGLLPPLLRDPGAHGAGSGASGHRIMVEFSAPNTNKPQHLGHMRTNFLGDSVSRLLKNAAAHVVRANLYNDRGIQICKSMVAYLHWGGGSDPEQEGIKGDHYVGTMYVRFEQELKKERTAFIEAHPEHFDSWRAEHGKDRKGRPLADDAIRAAYEAAFREELFGELPLGRECQQMLRDWEAGDAEVRALWERMNGWTFRGFDATYERLGIAFDHIYRESEVWEYGKELVLAGLERGQFQRRPDGAVEIDLSEHGLGRKVVLRSDGTSVYMTQDIGTTVKKAEEHRLDGQIWVVAEEQKHHFKVLFKILEALGYSWAGGLHHLAYGLVHLPEGRMKSREGRVVDADDLMDEVRDLAAGEIRSRDEAHSIPDEEVLRRAEVIALAALRFMLLKVTPVSNMTFNPAESVKFEGDTGARLLYAYARLRTMIRDAGEEAETGDADLSGLGHDTERHLMLRLIEYPRITAKAAADYNPSLVCGFLLDLTRDLNRFYEQCPVLRENDPALRRARLHVCRAVAAVMAHAADLLGLPLLERM